MLGYHVATNHSPASVRSNQHELDWANQPLPFKIYTSLEPIPLPNTFAASELTPLEAIAGAPPGTERPLELETVGRLCYFANGITRVLRRPQGSMPFRAAACTGALYHIELYVVCGGLAPDLDAGVYHYGAHDNALRRLRAGDWRRLLVDATGAEPTTAAAPVLLVLTSTFWRNAWKYQARAYRHAFWDSGTILANLFAVANANGISANLVHGFVDAEVNRLVDVDPIQEVAVCLVALGRDASGAPPPPAIEPLNLPTQRLSTSQVDYPLIHEAHAASALASLDDVAQWRAHLRPLANLSTAARDDQSARPSSVSATDPVASIPPSAELPSHLRAKPQPVESQGTDARQSPWPSSVSATLPVGGSPPSAELSSHPRAKPQPVESQGTDARQSAWPSSLSATDPADGSLPLGASTKVGESDEDLDPSRRAARSSEAAGKSGDGSSTEGAPSIEAVILRRGSSRRFGRDSISSDQLAVLLEAASSPIASDVAGLGSLTQPYLIVNAVDGLGAGAYVYSQEQRQLELLRPGDFRQEATFLDLAQPLAGDAAFNVYWLANLQEVLDRLGERGYRVAQLEAAIQGGKLYLAAYALGLGATGLTFFDDDVTRFFSPHAAGKCVMFLTAVGHPQRGRG